LLKDDGWRGGAAHGISDRWYGNPVHDLRRTGTSWL